MYVKLSERNPFQLIRARMILALGDESPKDVWLDERLVNTWASDLLLPERIRLGARLWGSQIAPCIAEEYAQDVSLPELMVQIGLVIKFTYEIDINPLSRMRILFRPFEWEFVRYNENRRLKSLRKLPHREWDAGSGSVFAFGPLMLGKTVYKCGASGIKAMMNTIVADSVTK